MCHDCDAFSSYAYVWITASTKSSADLQRDLAHTIDAYVAAGGSSLDAEQLSRVTEGVCNEVHALGLKPQQMVIALRTFHEAKQQSNPVAQELRRAA